MHTDFRVDQADGLRKLLLGDRYRVITLMAGKAGLGRTSAILSLASALAKCGKKVLVLDENNAPNNISGRLRLPTGLDFLDAFQGRCQPDEVVRKTGGYQLLSTARAVREVVASQTECSVMSTGSSKCAGLQNPEHILSDVMGRVDLILVDAAMPTPALGEKLSSRYRELVTRKNVAQPIGCLPRGKGQRAVASRVASGAVLLIMVDGTSRGITEGYASIKRLALDHQRMQFEIVVSRVADETAAVTVYENMARLARRDLAVRLELLGWIPQDDNIKRANQLGKAVVDLFPTSASALSYFGLAQKLACMPLRQEEVEGSAYTLIHDLIIQSSQSQYRHPEKLYTL